MARALFLVDLQQDSCTGGEMVIAVANASLALCVRCGIPVVASQDWHPQDHGSFAVNAGQQINTLGTLDDLAQIWWPVHCVQNTAGAAD